ncbi:MAG: SurA N-terminal domain-containing protein [Hyphomicrobiaceae bacterium]
MLEAIRKGASSWIVKVLVIAPLIVAFAIWGIEDMLRTTSATTIAKVGDREIGVEEFQSTYNNQIELYSRQLGRRLTPQQAQAFGIPQQLLSNLIAAAAVDQHADAMSLALSDEAIARDIQQDPAFRDASGAFSRALLSRELANLGMSERRFIDERRRDALRNQLAISLIGGTNVPPQLIDLKHRYDSEGRVVRYLVLQRDPTDSIVEPDESVLKSFFEARRSDFRTPETRHITVLELTTEAVRSAMTIDEADLRRSYDANIARFTTAERRRIEQIRFPDRAAAEAARQALLTGKSFAEVAEAAGVAEGDRQLGLLTRAAMIDTKVADAAFALEAEAISDVVEGNFAIVILRVTEIQAGAVRSFDDVRTDLRDEIASQRAGAEIERLHDLIDEAKLAGRSAQDIAEELKISFKDLTSVTRDGAAPDGTLLLTGADARATLAAAFQTGVGVEAEPIRLAAGGYAWVNVVAINEAKDRDFEEVRADVLARWRADEADKALRSRAQALVDQIAGGATLESLAGEAGLDVLETESFVRGANVPNLPSSVVAQAFTLGVGGASAAPADDQQRRIVFEVASVTPPPALEADEREKIEDELRQQLSGDVVAQYLSALRQDFPVTINEAALNRALGLDTP